MKWAIIKHILFCSLAWWANVVSEQFEQLKDKPEPLDLRQNRNIYSSQISPRNQNPAQNKFHAEDNSRNSALVEQNRASKLFDKFWEF